MLTFLREEKNIEWYQGILDGKEFNLELDRIYNYHGNDLVQRGFFKKCPKLRELRKDKNLDHSKIMEQQAQNLIIKEIEQDEDMLKLPLWIPPIVSNLERVEEVIRCDIELHLLPDVVLPDITNYQYNEFNFDNYFDELFKQFLDVLKLNFNEKIPFSEEDVIDEKSIIDIEIEDGDDIKPLTIGMNDLKNLDEEQKKIYYNNLIGKKLNDNVKIKVQGTTYKDDRVRAKHLLVKVEEECLNIKKMIENGEMTFLDQISEYSTCPSKDKGGDLGWFTRGQMVRPFEEQCFNNEPGLVGPIKTQFGFHLILIESKIKKGQRKDEKDIIITILNAWKLQPVKEITDETVPQLGISGVSTLDELKEHTKTKCEDEFIEFSKIRQKKKQLFNHIIKNQEVELSEKSIEVLNEKEEEILYQIKQSYFTTFYGQKFEITDDKFTDDEIKKLDYVIYFIKETNLLHSKEEVQKYLQSQDQKTLQTYKTIYIMDKILEKLMEEN